MSIHIPLILIAIAMTCGLASMDHEFRRLSDLLLLENLPALFGYSLIFYLLLLGLRQIVTVMRRRTS